MRSLPTYCLCFALVAILFSCSDAIQYKQVSDDFSNLESSAGKKEIDSLLNNIPKYSEICRNIHLNNVSFNQNLLLDYRTAELYQNSKETSFAMGMFVADLGYARYFEKVQVCTDIFDATQTIAGKLAVGEDVLSKYVPVIEENLNNEQVIFATIDSLLNTSTIVPAENEKYGISALFISGFWIETTHLGLAQNIENNEKNIESLENHFKILLQINELLSHLSDNDIIHGLKNDMKNIETAGPASQSLSADIETIRSKFIKII